MRWLVLLAIVLMLAPEMPDGVIQLQRVSFQGKQIEAVYTDVTSLREAVAEWMRRLDELAAVLRRPAQ